MVGINVPHLTTHVAGKFLVIRAPPVLLNGANDRKDGERMSRAQAHLEHRAGMYGQ